MGPKSFEVSLIILKENNVYQVFNNCSRKLAMKNVKTLIA